MKTKKVTRYYCDHCNRGMFKADAMKRHEAVCYRNRQRVCHRCGNDPSHAISQERKAQIAECGEIQTVAGECPDCLMAHAIQAFRKHDTDDGPCPWYPRERYEDDRRAWDKEHGWDVGVKP